MGRHYHIITCDDSTRLTEFISRGMVGVRPVKSKSSKSTSNQISASVRMNWDILADIARVKLGDYVFLHTSGEIVGVFEVVDNPIIEKIHAKFFDGPSISTDNWRDNWDDIEATINGKMPIWWIPIRPLEGLSFKEMSMEVIFDRIARGDITSLPQRLRYEDKNKTIKGITEKDFRKILSLFYNYSATINLPSHSNRLIRSEYRSITIDYLTPDGYEKNLEAIIVDRIRRGAFDIAKHTHVLNTVPLGYLKMADLVSWVCKDNAVSNPWIWELKTKPFNKFSDLREEIRKLSIRASYIGNLLDNGYKVTGVIVAKDFSEDVLQSFDNLILPIGPLEEILLISYTGTEGEVRFGLERRIR